MKDVEVVFHCAALVRDYAPKKQFFVVNVEGTKNLVEACRGQNLKRFVFLSHIQYEKRRWYGYYSITKDLAEAYLRDRFAEDNFPVVVVRPGNVYGPGPSAWVVRPVQAIQQNRIALIDQGRGVFLHTYIDNLVDALMSAMQSSQALGETIDVTDGDYSVTWGQYLNTLATLIGKDPIQRNMSKTQALLVGRIMMVLYWVFGVSPWITPMAVDVFTNQKTVSLEKAKELLGYTPQVGYSEGMKQVEKWLKSAGYISSE